MTNISKEEFVNEVIRVSKEMMVEFPELYFAPLLGDAKIPPTRWPEDAEL